MDNSTELSFLLEREGRLFGLIVQANTVAQELAQRRYDGHGQWKAEIRITMTHGLDAIEALFLNPPPPERYKVKVEICSEYHKRVLNLAEAELILQHLRDRDQQS